MSGDYFSSPPPRPDRLRAHPTTYPMGTGGKAAGAWSWPLHSPLSLHGVVLNIIHGNTKNTLCGQAVYIKVMGYET